MANFRLSRKICICLIIVLIFSNSVFAISVNSSVNAQASYTRIGQFNQYITNNYGTQNADVNTSLLIGMYQSLAKLAAPGVAYGIDRVNHTYYLTGTLTYLQEYLMQITENQYDIYKTEDTYLDGLSSAVTDIKTNTTNSAASDLASLTFLGSLEKYGYKNANDSVVLFDSAFYNRGYWQEGGLTFTNNNSTGVITISNITPGAGLYFVLPTDNPSYYIMSFDIYVNGVKGFVSSYFGGVVGDPYEIRPSLDQTAVFYQKYTGNLVSAGIIFNSGFADSTVTISNLRVIASPDLYTQQQILDAIENVNVDVDINDSVNVTPILLDVQIGINDFTEVNTISNKLRTWLSTGVGVSALIGALDQLDDSFFTLYNRNVIETINSGYTDFYD